MCKFKIDKVITQSLSPEQRMTLVKISLYCILKAIHCKLGSNNYC